MLHPLRLGAALGLASLLSACTHNTVIPGATCVGNCVNGQGTLTYSNLTESGTYSLGQRTGRFESRLADGSTMTADMVNGMAHGPVVIRRADGAQFEQRFAFGLPVEGTSLRDNGDRYEGSFVTDASYAPTWAWTVRMTPARTSEYVWVHPATYVTHFDRGTYTTADGRRYKGQFSLAGGRIVFQGETANAKGTVQRSLLSSPVPVNRAPLALTELAPKELAELQSMNAKLGSVAVVTTLADVLANITPDVAAARNKNAPAAVAAAAAAPAAVATVAAAPKPAKPTFNVIEGNTGLFLSPITSDGVAAAWVDKSVNASLGSSLGSAAGAYAGQKALNMVPFVGGFLGSKAGAAAGRQVAISAAGGEAYMRQTSDISFNNINDMARWLVYNHASHPKFAEIMKAAGAIYPELTAAYQLALSSPR